MAEDDTVKIGVVAAESGSFVSAGHTLPAGVSLAVKQINDAGGIKVGGKTYKIELVKPRRPHRYRAPPSPPRRNWCATSRCRRSSARNRTTSRWPWPRSPSRPRSSISPATRTLGKILTTRRSRRAARPTTCSSPSRRSSSAPASTARGVLSLLEPLLGFKPKKSVMIVGNDATGQFLSSYYFKALKAEGQEVPDIIFYPPDTTDFSPFLTRAKSLESGRRPLLVQWRLDADGAAAGAGTAVPPRATSCSASTPASGRSRGCRPMCRWR